MVDTAASLVVEHVLVPLAKPVGRQLGYIHNYESNVEELRELARQLEGQRNIISHKVEEAERNGQNIENYVTDWLENARSKITQVDKFLGDERHQKTKTGFPNLSLRHGLGRQARKRSLECDQLLQRAKDITAISYNTKPGAIEAAIYDTCYVPFKSREATMKNVMNALRDPATRIFGICGQGGVGKTAFVKEVARRAKAEKQLFSEMVIANVTSNPDVRKIQGEMADMLGLKLDSESPIGRADRLRQRLRRENNVLVILDDLWAGFDLNMLGIHFGEDEISQMTVKDTVNDSQGKLEMEKSPDDTKGCKILVASRSEAVILNEMNVKKRSIFSLDVLEKGEAVQLFKNVAKVGKEDSELKSLSAKVANRCEGLPMAIITVAKALMKNKNKFAWEKSLEQMERQGVVEAPVEFSTKLSYDQMQSEELKSFFLLCARMSKSPSITDLVKYCIGLGIFHGVHTVKEARDRTHTMVKTLKASNLLLNAGSSDQVTMSNLVREAALSISRKEEDIFTMRYGTLDEWPDKENFQRYTTISLHHCDISDGIPENLNCPKLKVFQVESNGSSLILPDNIFEGMGELRVLVLIGIRLPSLPSSIKSLKKLRMLCLEHCFLGGNISIIGELKNLRVLSLSGSEFEIFPKELGQLSKLLFLDISNCPELRLIPSNVISNLISLEELYVENEFIQWGVEGETNPKKSACLDELWHLQQLKRLNIHVHVVTTLPRSLSYDKLDGYKIVVGHFETDLFEDFKMRCMVGASRALALQFKKGYNNVYFHIGFIKLLFKSVDHLLLGELDGVQNVDDELNLEGFPCLKHLTILNNHDIQYIINSTTMAFPKLESLCFHDLQKMEKICNIDLLNDTSFCNLRTIKINICNRLKNLFPSFMVSHLTKLEIIEVSGCDCLQQMVSAETLHDIKFPQLHTLTLQSLPKLASFYGKEITHPISREDEHSVADDFQTLFNKNVSIQNLTHLIVKECHELKYLFSLSMVKSLGNLQSLSVERCAKMERIFEPENKRRKTTKGIDVLPKLRKMELTFMDDLETVWYDQAGLQSFFSLEYVIVKDCNKLKTIFPNYMVGRFSSLGILEVINCKLVKQIFDLEDSEQIDGRSKTNLWRLHIKMLPKLRHIWSRNQKQILDFENLQNVQIMDCAELEHVFTISVANDLSRLEHIRVSRCPKLKEIVSNEGMPNKNDIEFGFHQLTTIAFQQLPQLTRFYQESHSIMFSALKQLYLIRCEKLATENSVLSAVKKVISTLEVVGLGPKEMVWFQNCIGNDVYQLRTMKTLYLDGLNSVDTLLWFLRRTPNLENLLSVRCLNKDDRYSGGRLVPQAKIGTVVHLKSLRLWHFHVAIDMGFLNHPIIQRVEQLYIVYCSGLITLFPSSISFTHLTYLEVSRCPRLKNLMTSSTAKSLVELVGMKIIECKLMKEIVIKEETERVDEIVFSKLKSLELVELSSLKCFCSYMEGLAFKFPSLERLILRGCFKMEYFCKNISCIPKLVEVTVVEKEKGYWTSDLNATIKRIFKDMVFFQFTEELQYFQHRELEEVCKGRVPVPDNCFRNIKSLVVTCHISSAFLSKLLSCLKNLEKLEISDNFTEAIVFDLEKLKEMNGDSLRLKTLTLCRLENIKCVWSKDPDGFVSFPNLQEVVVNHCVKLETLLPASMTKNLVKLEISKCNELVEIVGKLEAMAFEQNSTFQLPSLTSLLLDELPKLQCFSPGISNLKCPKLGALRVIKCMELDIFTSQVPNRKEAYGHEDEAGTSAPKQPLFFVEEVITSLETLWLTKKMTSFLCHIQNQSDTLTELKELKELKLFFGDDDSDAATILPSEFLQKLPNLKSLSIEHFNSLETKYIDSNSIKFQNLEDLQVKSCPFLTNLVSSPVSFDKLKNLIITECHKLDFLLSTSVAKSLVQLDKMIIKECNSLKQIVSPGTDESASDKVIFEKLTAINLISLSSLDTFYEGNAALHFPILQVAIIIKCPMMKKFSQGVIEAPNFMAIQASQDHCDLHYSDGLNSTVEKVFWNQIRGIQDLKFGDHPELKDIWHGGLQIQEMSFSKLKSLVMECCQIGSSVPFHILPHLSNLEALEVRKCDTVKTIFDVKEGSGQPSSSSLKLKILILEELPSLEHIWNENPQGILSLQYLQQVCVDRCDSIKSLFPASLAIDKLETLEVKYCDGLEEIIEKDKTEASSKVFIFHNLSSLTLWELPELKYFYSLHRMEWLKLNRLNVYKCCKLMRTITAFLGHLPEANVTDEQAIESVRKVVPKLEELLLNENDVMMFSQEKFEGRLFNSIRYLKLMCYQGDQTEFPCRFFLKVRNIEKLLVGCSRFREIFPSMVQSEDYSESFTREFGFLPCLKELELIDLGELEYIGLEHSWHAVPHLLKSLRVVECSSLIHLVVYPVSFSSLVDLTVTKCHKLEYVFTSSTAKSLTSLKNMSISKCDSMKVVIAEVVNSLDKEEVMIGQLETVSLHSLPKLECFYSGSSRLKFASLTDVSITKCSIMEFFCRRGDLTTPQWPSDLNSGVQVGHTKAQSSYVQEDSIAGDRGPTAHHGALFEKLDSIAFDTRDFLTNMLNKPFVLVMLIVLFFGLKITMLVLVSIVFNISKYSSVDGQRSDVDKDSTEGDRRPYIHQGEDSVAGDKGPTAHHHGALGSQLLSRVMLVLNYIMLHISKYLSNKKFSQPPSAADPLESTKTDMNEKINKLMNYCQDGEGRNSNVDVREGEHLRKSDSMVVEDKEYYFANLRASVQQAQDLSDELLRSNDLRNLEIHQ